MTDQANIEPATALAAMRGCDLTDPESLIDLTTPEAIVDACTRWTAKRRAGENVGPGLLVSWIRRGGAPDRGRAQPEDFQTALRRRFNETTQAFPRGAAAEPHSRLQSRRWPDEKPCPGKLIVTDRIYPNLIARCDACAAPASYPLRVLLQLPIPTEKRKSVGLATDGIGSPLLTEPLAIPDLPFSNRKPAAVALKDTPFAATRMPADQANQDVAVFLSAFNLAVDTENNDQERWAYRKMAEAHMRLLGGSRPRPLDAMKWAAALRHPTARRSAAALNDGPTHSSSLTAIAENYFKNMMVSTCNGPPSPAAHPSSSMETNP